MSANTKASSFGRARAQNQWYEGPETGRRPGRIGTVWQSIRKHGGPSTYTQSESFRNSFDSNAIYGKVKRKSSTKKRTK